MAPWPMPFVRLGDRNGRVPERPAAVQGHRALDPAPAVRPIREPIPAPIGLRRRSRAVQASADPGTNVATAARPERRSVMLGAAVDRRQGMVHGRTFVEPITGEYIRNHDADLLSSGQAVHKRTQKPLNIVYEKMSKSKSGTVASPSLPLTVALGTGTMASHPATSSASSAPTSRASSSCSRSRRASALAEPPDRLLTTAMAGAAGSRPRLGQYGHRRACSLAESRLGLGQWRRRSPTGSGATLGSVSRTRFADHPVPRDRLITPRDVARRSSLTLAAQVNATINGITDIMNDRYAFNVAIADLMKLTNVGGVASADRSPAPSDTPAPPSDAVVVNGPRFDRCRHVRPALVGLPAGPVRAAHRHLAVAAPQHARARTPVSS